MEGFELVENPRISKVLGRISFTKTGQIYFPTAFFTKHHIDKKRAVLIYLDQKGNRIAFKFSDKITPEAYKMNLCHKYSNISGAIMAKGFLKQYGLFDPSRTRSYDTEYNAEHDMFIVDLEEGKE